MSFIYSSLGFNFITQNKYQKRIFYFNLTQFNPMKTSFNKYHGTGNDFIMIDNRSLEFDAKDQVLIEKMCSRRFGIGADGLILLENDEKLDFKMVYFNADGNESTMCGNGGRCIVAFAKRLNIIDKNAEFMAIDGYHKATINENFEVNLQMKNVEDIELLNQDFVLDTGSPHYVKIVDAFEEEFVNQARAIRNSDRFVKQGINVNFIKQLSENELEIRTFERGVEDETYACGTGCVASALSIMHKNQKTQEISLITKGGNIKVNADFKNGVYSNVWLWGPTAFVYSGNYNSTI